MITLDAIRAFNPCVAGWETAALAAERASDAATCLAYLLASSDTITAARERQAAALREIAL